MFDSCQSNILYDIANCCYLDCLLQSRKGMDERSAAVHMLQNLRLQHSYIVLMDRGKYDGLMTLGAVIRGETDHYQMIINAVTNATMTLNLEGKIPVTFGILTTDNIDQALQRSGLKVGNEGSATAQSLG